MPVFLDTEFALSAKQNNILTKIAQEENHKVVSALPKVVYYDKKLYLILVGNYAWVKTDGKLIDTNLY